MASKAKGAGKDLRPKRTASKRCAARTKAGTRCRAWSDPHSNVCRLHQADGQRLAADLARKKPKSARIEIPPVSLRSASEVLTVVERAVALQMAAGPGGYFGSQMAALLQVAIRAHELAGEEAKRKPEQDPKSAPIEPRDLHVVAGGSP